jgi:hypothetical protein
MKDVCRPAPFRYCHTGREEAALPQFVTPPVFVCLWLNVALLLSAAACVWMRRTPVYASGPAVVENCETSARNTRGTRVIAFLPPEHLIHLRIGQILLLRSNTGQPNRRSAIAEVMPEIIDPHMKHARFALSAAATAAISQRSAVVIARCESFRADTGVLPSAGILNRAEIMISSRRIMPVLPLIGRFFEE